MTNAVRDSAADRLPAAHRQSRENNRPADSGLFIEGLFEEVARFFYPISPQPAMGLQETSFERSL
jgi:hypothetical protein